LLAELDNATREQRESIYVVSAIKLLLFTGCRLTEIQKLKWEYINGDHIDFPDSKTDYKRIPLNSVAVSVLNEVPKLDCNPFVVAGKIEGQFCTDLQKPWRRIRKRVNLEHVRIHDLRHTFASHAVIAGHPLPIVAKLLGHTQIQTTMRYDQLADKEVALASANIGQELVSGI